MSSAGFNEDWLQLRGPLFGNPLSTVKQFSWSFDGKRITGPLDDNTLCIWNVTDCSIEHNFVVNGPIQCTAWSPTNALIAIGNGKSTIMLFDLLAQTIVDSRNCEGSGWISQISWNPRSNFLASASEDGQIRIWNTENSGPPLAWQGHLAHAQDLSWAPQGQSLASCGHDGTVKLWDFEGNQLKSWTVGKFPYLFCLAWSKTEDVIVVGGAEGRIYIINVEDKYSVRSLEGHSSDIMSVSFSFDGRLLASRSIDGVLRF
jgi:WD40 repeat protein